MAKTLPAHLPGVISSLDETISLSESSFSATESSSVSDTLNLALSHFASLAERLKPIIQELHNNVDPDIVPIKMAVESLDSHLAQTRALIKNCDGSPVAVQSMEECVHDLGRCLGLLLMAWADAPKEIREGMGSLHKEMMKVRIKGMGPGIMVDDCVVPDLEDVFVRVKRGENSGVALLELGMLIQKGLMNMEETWAVISLLLNRLGSAKSGERLKIILLLRNLCRQSDDNKVKFRLLLG